MEKALLDTDIFSELLRAKNAAISKRGSAYRQQFGRYSVSAVTVVEIIKGFQQAGRTDQVTVFTASLKTEDVFPLNEEAAILAGKIYGDLQRTGQSIGRTDPMMAAIAIQRDLHWSRVTRNTSNESFAWAMACDWIIGGPNAQIRLTGA
jgi:tRNA(fMet)-specific endonuclease VapC